MELALEQARAAAAMDEVPIGAVVLGPSGDGDDHVVLARAHNRTRIDGDPTAHAEMLAMRAAAQVIGHNRLLGCTLVTTVEPCFMCAGACVHARLARVIWAVRDPKFGGAASLGEVLSHPGLNHQVPFLEGVAADEARTLMQEFFRSKR